MKISQLIQTLKEIRQEHGEIDIATRRNLFPGDRLPTWSYDLAELQIIDLACVPDYLLDEEIQSRTIVTITGYEP